MILNSAAISKNIGKRVDVYCDKIWQNCQKVAKYCYIFCKNNLYGIDPSPPFSNTVQRLQYYCETASHSLYFHPVENRCYMWSVGYVALQRCCSRGCRHVGGQLKRLDVSGSRYLPHRVSGETRSQQPRCHPRYEQHLLQHFYRF